jgi:hypothetical protein
MKKQLAIIGVIVLFICVGLSGCMEEQKRNLEGVSFQLTTGPLSDEDPFLIEDSNGVYWCVWCSNRSGNGDIWYSNSLNMENWSEPAQLTTNLYDDWYPSLIQDSNDEYWVAWMSWRKNNYDIWCSNSKDGTNWSEPIQITRNSSTDWAPHLIQDSSDIYWIVFSSERSGNKDIWYVTSADGKNWSNPIQFTTDISEDDCPSLVQDSKGTYWIVWHSDKQGKYDIYYSNSIDEITWSTPTLLTDQKSIDVYPFIIQDSDDKYWIIWTSDKSDIQGDIWYCTSENGHIWSTPTRFTTATSKDYSPKIIEDSPGIMWITWVSNRSGNLDIWYSKIK